MEWTDDAIILGSRPLGETRAVVELFTRDHGRQAGVVHGGASRKTRPMLQPGNLVSATWKARTGEQLGFFSPLELEGAYAALLFDDSAALAGLTSAITLLRENTAERQASPRLFEALHLLAQTFAERELWPALYTRFEIGLLAEIGYGLDLTECAMTGAREGLGYVSPRTGRAATKEAGAPFKDKLLRLPPYLTDPDAPLVEGDVADGLALAGFFLEHRVYDQLGRGMPDARRRMIEALGFSGRL